MDMKHITSIIESYGLGEMLLALVAGVGTLIGGLQFAIAFGCGVGVAYMARAIDRYGTDERGR